MTSPLSESELPQLTTLRAVELMRTALESPPGLKIVTSNNRAAIKLRRQLYGARRRARSRGDHSLDGLSITVRNVVVSVIVRQLSPGAPLRGIENILPLERDQLPVSIGSRGRNKIGLHAALVALAVLEGRHP